MKFEKMINTIQLGDCYELIKQIPDKSIDLVYIDIPYLIGYGGSEEKKSKLAKRIQKEDQQIAHIKNGICYKKKHMFNCYINEGGFL